MTDQKDKKSSRRLRFGCDICICMHTVQKFVVGKFLFYVFERSHMMAGLI